MSNTLRQRTTQPRLGGIVNEQYLQESLSRKMSKTKERERYTSKTWQKSGCTLTAHPDDSRENAIALSGHGESGGGHYSTYVDYCNSL
mmetsp:Transcript_28836/g.32339  ORF Transcript_28836/g.32339 Transcript_28836/m.32339 type:complete len:88 (-) Transcript_28836:153-416(-)